MHQLAVQSIGWAMFFHSTLDGVYHSSFFFVNHYIILYLILDCFSVGPNFIHSYLTHLLTLINTTPTLVPYLLSPVDIATIITNYPIDLVTILTTYPIDLATLHTQALY
jgi:hypothetical protein